MHKYVLLSRQQKEGQVCHAFPKEGDTRNPDIIITDVTSQGTPQAREMPGPEK